MNKYLLFLAFASIPFFVIAQCDDFIVYQTKGKVLLLQGTSSVPAKKNAKITTETKLSVSADAVVILLSGKNKALRINTPGTLSFADLNAICMKNQSSLTKEYFNYVAQSTVAKGEAQTAMVVKGAVYRSRNQFGKPLMMYPADSSVVTGGKVCFTWHRYKAGTQKYLIIFENGVKKVYSKQTADTSITLESTIFKKNALYFWLVTSSQTPSDKEPRFSFVHTNSDWQKKFLDEWSSDMKEFENEFDKGQTKYNQEKKQKDSLK